MLLAEFVKDFGIKKYFRTTKNLKYSLLSNFIELVLEGNWVGNLEIPKDFSQTEGIGEYFTQLNTSTAELRFGDVYIVLSSARYRYGIYLDDETVIEQPNHLDPQHKTLKFNVAENTAALKLRGYTVIWLRPLNEKNIFPPYMLGANSYVIPTVAAMKNIDLPIGMVVTTSGYYAVDDGAGAKYMIVSGSFTDDGGLYHSLNNGNFAKLVTKNNIISVRVFGAKGDGETDDTAAFLSAQLACNTNKVNLYIPSGDYVISSPLPYPNYYRIIGDGYKSNMVLNLSNSQYAFYDSTNFRYGWSISDLRFTIKSGSSTNVGAIYIEKSLRGGEINNIWTYDLEKPFYFGSTIWGNLSIKNIHSYLVSHTGLSPETAMTCLGNTLSLDGIEIIGAWERGLYFNGCRVASLLNYNIGGSTGAQMRRAIKVENCNLVSIINGWIEQLDGTYWSNGNHEAIYIKDSHHVKVFDCNVANGSVYMDGGSNNTLSQIQYAQINNAGIKHLNGAIYTFDSTAAKVFINNLGNDYLNGFGYQLDVNRDSGSGLFKNPIILSTLPSPVAPTNSSFVTINNNTLDFESGDRSLEVTTANTYQGVKFETTAIPGKLYTCVVRVKLIENASDIYLTGFVNAIRDPSSLWNGGTKEIGKWKTFLCTISSTTNTVSFRLVVKGVTGTAKFLVDSVQIYRGVNHLSPENIQIDL